MLLFKKRFYEDIAAGRKTATLRYWRRPMVRPNSVHLVPKLGRVRIQEVREASLTQLTDSDARDDGFESLAELASALEQMYDPEQMHAKTLYQVRFQFIGDADPPE
jgi:hypothetical protein